jgi:hypothetical protein
MGPKERTPEMDSLSIFAVRMISELLGGSKTATTVEMKRHHIHLRVD